MNFLIDKEKNLNNDDLLNTRMYAKTLEEIILSSPVNEPFTIGLFGEWGSGKSSIIKTAIDNIKTSNTNQKIKFILYDAWKYSNDSFRRTFLLKVQSSLKFDKTEIFDNFYQNKDEEIDSTQKFDWNSLLLIFLIPILTMIFLFIPFFSNMFTIDFKLPFAVIINTISLAFALIKGSFTELKTSIRKLNFFAPEQFEWCFDEMIQKSLKKYTGIQRVHKYITGERYDKNIDKLVIIIDNIDRCPKDLAHELLTNTKNFLGNKGNILFIIPVDENALKKHILRSDNDNTDKEADEFLRKYFNTSLRIKIYTNTEMFKYVKSLNDINNLQLNPTTIEIISKEYATNPRRIIQFLNNFTVEIQNLINSNKLDQKFITDNQSIVAKILILREEWPDYYKMLTINPSFLNKPNDEIIKLLEKNNDLRVFLRTTNALTKSISTKILYDLLENSNLENELSKEVIESINEKDINKIVQNIKNNQEIDTSDIINFLTENIRKGLLNKTYSTSVANNFDILIGINDEIILKKAENLRITSYIEHDLDNFIEFIDNSDHLAKYSKNLYDQNNNFLIDFIIKNIYKTFNENKDSQWKEIDSIFVSLLEKVIKQSYSKSIMINLKSAFLEHYKFSESSILDYEINISNYNYLTTVTLIDFILSGVLKIVSDSKWDDLMTIVENYTKRSSFLKKILTTIQQLYPSFNNINNEELKEVLKSINQLLKYFETTHDTNILELFTNLCAKNRSVKITNRQQVNYNFLNNELNNKESMLILAEFCYNSYRLSKSCQIVNIYSKIFLIFPEVTSLIYSYLNKLNETKNLTDFIPMLFKDKVSSDFIDIFSILSIEKSNIKYTVTDEQLYTKLKEILEIIISTENSEYKIKLVTMLIKINENARVNKNMTNIVSSFDASQILSLPEDLYVLTFDKIIEEIDEYTNHLPLLKAMSLKGEKRHITKVVKVILSKFLDDKIEDALSIISSLTKLNNTDKRRIVLELEKLIEDEHPASDLANEQLDRISRF